MWQITATRDGKLQVLIETNDPTEAHEAWKSYSSHSFRSARGTITLWHGDDRVSGWVAGEGFVSVDTL